MADCRTARHARLARPRREQPALGRDPDESVRRSRPALAALLLACALLASGCSGATTDPYSPVAAEAVGSDLVAPLLAPPGDFPAPLLETPSDPGADGAGSAGEGTDESGSDESGSNGADSPDEDSTASPGAIPGIGPETMAEVPDDTRQIVVSTTEDADDTDAATTLYERTDDAWTEVRSFDGHNGDNGWLRDRREGDATSPIGVFPLSDAGGYLDDPGSLLPYTQDTALRSGAASTYGDDYAEVFDYVIAIDYNRVAGTPPTDDERPMGWDAGGKIWLHVDHDSPTRGCITVEKADMEYLLRTIDPELNPHIIMGPADDISR